MARGKRKSKRKKAGTPLRAALDPDSFLLPLVEDGISAIGADH